MIVISAAALLNIGSGFSSRSADWLRQELLHIGLQGNCLHKILARLPFNCILLPPLGGPSETCLPTGPVVL